ncbi:hypothetical protein M1B72_17060 [Geomonas paludis]|uniref:Uncharacterized protein n=1 Tax=Geomonas paludis TaxID=2740185 RepID=A0A6V8N0Q6_9BACT|nr:hypothetical protein [Geomonas paludis]UPU35146.1 hypothetical protein M1B72_17060 [Geomonas paludis]GFO65467.1 hypothetical protein GMPD_33860 [Geomonas paludis]
MSKYVSGFLVGVVFLVQTTVALAGQLSSSVEQYKMKVQLARANETNVIVQTYLEACLTGASALDGLEVGDPRVPDALKTAKNARIKAIGGLTPDTSNSSGVSAEVDAYNMNLQPYLKSHYINLVSLQDQLLERKYFKTETAKNANFLEGYVNSNWSLTRADHTGEALHRPNLGISPWEAIFRFEPTLAFEHGAQVAIMGTAGLSYTFFPEIDQNTMPFVFKENFLSNWVRKSGFRLGIGVGNLDERAKLLLGAGTQLNALGLWGLYKPDGSSFMFGLSASDLSKFKKAVSWFQ